MDRMFFIVNPVAGSGKCNALFSECETILRERGIEYIVKKTEKSSLLRQAATEQ